MKKSYSISLDEDLILSMKRYYFINWSKIVNTDLKKHMKKYRTELEELLNAHLKLKEAEI